MYPSFQIVELRLESGVDEALKEMQRLNDAHGVLAGDLCLMRALVRNEDKAKLQNLVDLSVLK